MAERIEPLPTVTRQMDPISSIEQQLNGLHEREHSLLGLLKAACPDDRRLVQISRELAMAQASILGELKALANRLQTLEASYATLVNAHRLAEEANLRTTRLFAGASHDLLQPLGATRLFLSTLRSTQLRPENRHLVERADKALTSAEQLLGSLLEISEMDANGIQPEMTTFPISSLLKTLENEFEPMAVRKNLQLSIVFSTTRIVSDLPMLRRVLQNLISNAIHYTDSGKVLIGCRKRSEGLRIEIWDSGHGIEPTELDKIFDEFYRVQPQTVTEGRHVGLGLSIVRRLAQTLQHRISVVSRPGRGSCFAVTVPYGRAMPVLRPDDVIPRPRPRIRPLSSISVVLVENDLDMLQAMTQQLVHWSCRVIPAASPKEAREFLYESGQRPDVLIVDQHLGHPQTGLEFISQTRAEQGAALPAILITADSSAQLKEAAYQAGCRFLAKPFEAAELRALICNALS